MSYRLTRRARRDALRIWRPIAEDNESAADRFIDLLVRRFRMLSNNPYAGRARDELRTSYRSFPIGEYLYRLQDGGVDIMRVVHGRRDLGALFLD